MLPVEMVHCARAPDGMASDPNAIATANALQASQLLDARRKFMLPPAFLIEVKNVEGPAARHAPRFPAARASLMQRLRRNVRAVGNLRVTTPRGALSLATWLTQNAIRWPAARRR